MIFSIETGLETKYENLQYFNSMQYDFNFRLNDFQTETGLESKYENLQYFNSMQYSFNHELNDFQTNCRTNMQNK